MGTSYQRNVLNSLRKFPESAFRCERKNQAEGEKRGGQMVQDEAAAKGFGDSPFEFDDAEMTEAIKEFCPSTLTGDIDDNSEGVS